MFDPRYKPVIIVCNSASIVTLPGEIGKSIKWNLFVLIDEHLERICKSVTSALDK